MKKSTSCTCHSEPDPCATGVIERPCYYPGQLLTPAEMTLEQQYFRDKLRRHNRLIHGWGVVCGAAVCRVPEEQPARDARGKPSSTDPNQPSPNQPAASRSKPWKVRVTPGYILGPYGDEILIDREQIVDLRTCGQTGVTGEHGGPADPWCVDVYVQRDPGPLYVAVRYQEMKSRPVRVQPAGCGCDETQCEYSRCRDGYEICVLTECPPSHENPPGLDGLFRGPLPDCPECPADPWVVLARVEIDADGIIRVLDNCSCRRLVASFASVWWQCSEERDPSQRVITVEAEGGGEPRPGSNFVLVARTHEMPQKVQVDLGNGVSVKSANVSADRTSVKIEAHVETNAVPGPRPLTIKDPATNQVVDQWSHAFQIAASAGGGEPQETKPTRPKKGGATGGKEPA